MRLMFFLFLIILNNKIKGKNYCKYSSPKYENIEPFHFQTSYSLSLGDIKYAIKIKTTQSENILNPNQKESFSVTREPIIPAVNTYFAASANIVATTFLLSLLILNYSTKRRQYESVNA